MADLKGPAPAPLPDQTSAPLDIEKQQALHAERTNSLLGGEDAKGAPVAVDYSGAAAKTDPEEIRLVRKLDRWIMPTLWVMYWLNYLDRNAIAVARLNDIEEDLNLSSVEYSTAVSILFVGYILGQIPSNMVLTRVKPSFYSTLSWSPFPHILAVLFLRHEE